MRCLTNSECLEWLRQHHIEAASKDGVPEVVGSYEVFFAAPAEARIQQNLARDLVAWTGEFARALFWILDWPFYKQDEMALISGLRHAHGEYRRLVDAPGHVFEFNERDELIGWVYLMISYGWDGYLFTAPFRGRMFQTSHEDFIWVTASEQDQFGNAKEIARKCNVEIYRESGPMGSDAYY